MNTTTGSLLAADGTRLFYREWPVAKPRAALVLVHGLGEHGGRYAHVATRLNSHDIAVRIADLRGHGRSDGPRGGLRHADDYLDDLKLVLDDYALQLGTTPFLLGHSLGGLIAARFATGDYSPVRGLILASPALALRLSLFESMLFAFSSIFAPNLSIDNRIAVDGISHDPSVTVDAESDKLNHHQITPRLLGFMLNAIDRVREDAPRFTKPALLLVAGADPIVNAQGSRDFHDRLPEATRSLRWYDEAYHELFNEIPAIRLRVLNDLCIWLDAQIPKPSRF